MSAQSQRLNVTASNLANADSTTGPDGQPYKAKQVVFGVAPIGGARTGSGPTAGDFGRSRANRANACSL